MSRLAQDKQCEHVADWGNRGGQGHSSFGAVEPLDKLIS